MICRLLICPHPPLLLRELQGREPVAAPLRAACLSSVRELARDVDHVVILTGTPNPSTPSTGTPNPGTPVSGSSRPALGLRVARELLGEAVTIGTGAEELIPFDAAPAECARRGKDLGTRIGEQQARAGLLVMADGTARRGPQAPGHFDPRAAAVDDVVTTAAATGDPAALAALAGVDPELAAELWFQGRAALQVLAGMPLPAPARIDVRYRDDPFGVMYVVALWSYQPPLP